MYIHIRVYKLCVCHFEWHIKEIIQTFTPLFCPFSSFLFYSLFFFLFQTNILTNIKSINKNVKVIVLSLSTQTPIHAHKTWLSISTTNTLMDIMSNLHALQLGQVLGHKLMVRLVLDFQSTTDVLIPRSDCVWKIITLSHVSSFQSCPEFWDRSKQTEKKGGGLGRCHGYSENAKVLS